MLCVDEHRTFSFRGKWDLTRHDRRPNEGERNNCAQGQSNLDIKTVAPEEIRTGSRGESDEAGGEKRTMCNFPGCQAAGWRREENAKLDPHAKTVPWGNLCTGPASLFDSLFLVIHCSLGCSGGFELCNFLLTLEFSR